MDAEAAIQKACDLAQSFEGFRSAPYQDAAGVWTRGYGQTHLEDGTRVTAATPPVTEAEARAELLATVESVFHQILLLVKVPLTTGQAAALTDFAFNLGVYALKSSTLLRLVNEGDFADAANEFGKWVYGGGRKLTGLVRRRVAERALFVSTD